jgi:hypothetical protein
MKLAIMQPYFFPYPGYFSLIKRVDEFILFDTPQFIRHGWVDRNRILNEGDPLYIRPAKVKHSNRASINEILLKNDEPWKTKIIDQLNTYHKAPYFEETKSILDKIFEDDIKSLVNFNKMSIQVICNYLDIKTTIKIWSEMNLTIGDVQAPDEWALRICEAMKAQKYINPIGGLELFDSKKYEAMGIDIQFLDCLPEYNQFDKDFIPGLSIIDMLMFNSKDQINQMLDLATITRNDS